MKKLNYILGSFSLLIAGVSFGQELVPDQNPNYQQSAAKYAEKSDELTKNQGETIQDTYKAYDWREAKEEAKQQRLDRRYELKKLRYQSRGRCNQPGRFYNDGYYNNGYYNNWNNGGYNNFNNSGYYNNGGYYNQPNYNFVAPLIGAGLGVGLYYLLK
jgi:hypothetical protein